MKLHRLWMSVNAATKFKQFCKNQGGPFYDVLEKELRITSSRGIILYQNLTVDQLEGLAAHLQEFSLQDDITKREKSQFTKMSEHPYLYLESLEQQSQPESEPETLPEKEVTYEQHV